MAGGEVLTAGGQDDHPHLVVGLGFAHRLIELDQQAPVLRVVLGRTVQRDSGDPAFVQRFIGNELVRLSHRLHFTTPRTSVTVGVDQAPVTGDDG